MREVEFDSGGVGGEEKAIKNEILGRVNVLAQRLDLLLEKPFADWWCVSGESTTKST